MIAPDSLSVVILLMPTIKRIIIAFSCQVEWESLLSFSLRIEDKNASNEIDRVWYFKCEIYINKQMQMGIRSNRNWNQIEMPSKDTLTHTNT